VSIHTLFNFKLKMNKESIGDGREEQTGEENLKIDQRGGKNQSSIFVPARPRMKVHSDSVTGDTLRRDCFSIFISASG